MASNNGFSKRSEKGLVTPECLIFLWFSPR
jgi:hypothetical protein